MNLLKKLVSSEEERFVVTTGRFGGQYRHRVDGNKKVIPLRKVRDRMFKHTSDLNHNPTLKGIEYIEKSTSFYLLGLKIFEIRSNDTNPYPIIR